MATWITSFFTATVLLQHLHDVTSQASFDNVTAGDGQWRWTNPEERGTKYTSTYAVYLRDNDDLVSAWHDVPLFFDQKRDLYLAVTEIPRWESAHFVTQPTRDLSPIRQKVSSFQLQYLPNLFPYHGAIANLGFYPQTWMDPGTRDPVLQKPGNDRPLATYIVSKQSLTPGTVVRVKPIGVLAIKHINYADLVLISMEMGPRNLHHLIYDIPTMKQHAPGLLNALLDLYRRQGLDVSDDAGTVKKAWDVVEFGQQNWRRLITGQVDPGKKSLVNTRVLPSNATISQEEAARIVNNAPPYEDPAKPAANKNVPQFLCPPLPSNPAQRRNLCPTAATPAATPTSASSRLFVHTLTLLVASWSTVLVWS